MPFSALQVFVDLQNVINPLKHPWGHIFIVPFPHSLHSTQPSFDPLLATRIASSPFLLPMNLRSSLFLFCAFGLLTYTYPTRPEPITTRVCSTGPPSNGLRSAHHKLHAQQRLHPRQAASSPIVIDTYIHFVATADQVPYYNGSVVSTLIGNQVCNFRWFSPNLPLCF